MNKNFKEIVEINKDFLSTMNLIIDSSLEKEKSLFSTAINKTYIERELKSKKLSKYFKHVICFPALVEDRCLFVMDINGLNWRFTLEDKKNRLISVSKVFPEQNLIIKHDKKKSIICKNIDNSEPLLDITNKKLTESEAEFVYLTKDVDVSNLINFNPDNFFFSEVDGLNIKDAYAKKSIIKSFFKF